MKLDGTRWHFVAAPGISREELADAVHELSRYIVAPPRSKKELQAIAVRTALMNICEKGSISGRAKRLESAYRAYLTGPWRRGESAIESLPRPYSVQKFCLHRMARLGCASSWSQILRCAGADFVLDSITDSFVNLR